MNLNYANELCACAFIFFIHVRVNAHAAHFFIHGVAPVINTFYSYSETRAMNFGHLSDSEEEDCYARQMTYNERRVERARRVERVREAGRKQIEASEAIEAIEASKTIETSEASNVKQSKVKYESYK